MDLFQDKSRKNHLYKITNFLKKAMKFTKIAYKINNFLGD